MVAKGYVLSLMQGWRFISLAVHFEGGHYHANPSQVKGLHGRDV